LVVYARSGAATLPFAVLSAETLDLVRQISR
jgi:hypothetical protein